MSEQGAPSPIPQASPGRDYRRNQKDIDAAVRRALESGWYILGPEVTAFESEFASYLGLRDAVGVASGTDAVEMALRGLGIGPGDAVYTVSHTAVATVAAVERAGATPVLVDIDDATATMDPASLAAAIAADPRPRGAQPRAVIAVHLYGQPAPMAEILTISRRAGLLVVEDCAQAHGATLDGRIAGTMGDIASFSFYPTKNLAALGDGGCVATNDPAVAARIRELRQYGWHDRYVSAVPGLNSRLDELQAAILRARLPKLDADNARRKEIAARYDAGLAGAAVAGAPLTLPVTRAGAGPVYHQYVIRTPSRDGLMVWLRDRGIGTAIHYPVPIHLQPGYDGRIAHFGLATTERVAREIVSLPIFASLTDQEVDRVIAAIIEWSDAQGRGPAASAGGRTR
jgi:dTDP-4-amino-4,6-dideoxygalactose transaminase